jgi:hypothetical protein
VKGHRQYFLRLGAGAPALARSGLSIRTVCQVNAAVLPRLKDGGTQVTYAASQQAVVSAGPNRAQAKAHLIAGRFESPTVTLAMTAPRQRPISELYATAQVSSGNPPDRNVKYQIEYSLDAGATWQPIVKDWTFPKQGDEPPEFGRKAFAMAGPKSRPQRRRTFKCVSAIAAARTCCAQAWTSSIGRRQRTPRR